MKRILVVDDERQAASSLGELLQSDGFDVVALDSSRTALERIQGERFDAVVTDLEMPDVHGVEIVRAARASNGTLVVVVTAYAESPASRAALGAGAALVFPKPLDYERLLAWLNERLAPGS